MSVFMSECELCSCQMELTDEFYPYPEEGEKEQGMTVGGICPNCGAEFYIS